MSQCGQIFAREHSEDAAECSQQKEKIMDRNFYQQKLAEERQKEVSRELATRHLLKEGGHEPLTTSQAQRLVLRVAPVAIVVTILIILNFF